MNEQTSAQARLAPCPGCGSQLRHVPGTATLRCDHCGAEQPIVPVQRSVREHDYAELAGRPPAPPEAAVRAFACTRCGARTETDAISDACAFCGSDLVADVSAGERVPPEAVLPFQVDRAGVRTALRKWASSRWFAPSSLKKVTEAETLKGTYLPHWTYDAKTVSDYTGQRGEHYWVTETYTTTDADGNTQTQTRQVRKTRWYPASGTVRHDFDDVLVAATRRLPVDHLNKLAPWPLHQAVPYQPDYLAGRRTLRYEIEPEAGLPEAQQQMAPVIRDDCRYDIGGDEQRVHSVDTRYFDVTYKLMLLPVWVVGYLHGGRSWQVLVNGRTGEVLGERPYSKAKIAAAIALALALIAVLVVFGVNAKQ